MLGLDRPHDPLLLDKRWRGDKRGISRKQHVGLVDYGVQVQLLGDPGMTWSVPITSIPSHVRIVLETDAVVPNSRTANVSSLVGGRDTPQVQLGVALLCSDGLC